MNIDMMHVMLRISLILLKITCEHVVNSSELSMEFR